MSWMRSPLYVWGSGDPLGRRHHGDWIHIWVRQDHEADARMLDNGDGSIEDRDYPDFTGGISIRQDLFDALVLYRYAELQESPCEMRRARNAAKLDGPGNCGASTFWSQPENRQLLKAANSLEEKRRGPNIATVRLPVMRLDEERE